MHCDFEFEGGVNAMRQLLALDEPPHAVFAGNDAVAVGVYQALYQAGLSVPCGSDPGQASNRAYSRRSTRPEPGIPPIPRHRASAGSK